MDSGDWIPPLEGRSNYYIWKPLMIKHLILLGLLAFIEQRVTQSVVPTVQVPPKHLFRVVGGKFREEIEDIEKGVREDMKDLKVGEAGSQLGEAFKMERAGAETGVIPEGVEGKDMGEPKATEGGHEENKNGRNPTEEVQEDGKEGPKPIKQEHGDEKDKGRDGVGNDEKEKEKELKVLGVQEGPKALEQDDEKPILESGGVEKKQTDSEHDEIRTYVAIISRLNPKLQAQHVGSGTASKLWQDLEECHGYKSPASINLLRFELANIRLKEFACVDDFDSAFRGIMYKLELGDYPVLGLAAQFAFVDATKTSFPSIPIQLHRDSLRGTGGIPSVQVMMRVLRDMEMEKALELKKGEIRPDVNRSRWNQRRKLQKKRPPPHRGFQHDRNHSIR